MPAINKRYIVFICPRCGLPRYSRSEQKNAKCFGCGYQIPIKSFKVRILLRTDSRSEAVKAVKDYKMKICSGIRESARQRR